MQGNTSQKVEDMPKTNKHDELLRPEIHVHAVAITILQATIMHKLTTAEQITNIFGTDFGDDFKFSVLSRAGFCPTDVVDPVYKIGHLDRFCEAILNHCGYRIPEYCDKIGIYKGLMNDYKTLREPLQVNQEEQRKLRLERLAFRQVNGDKYREEVRIDEPLHVRLRRLKLEARKKKMR